MALANQSAASRAVSVSCQCACKEQCRDVQPWEALGGQSTDPKLFVGEPLLPVPDAKSEKQGSVDGAATKSSPPRGIKQRVSRGITTYVAAMDQPLNGLPLRVGEVWHLHKEDAKSFAKADLALHTNGFLVTPQNGDQPIAASWSPFSLVQACRLHSSKADAALPWLRIFKVSVFHHGVAHFFASCDDDEKGTQRARWVADVARALRMLTASLFPPFSIEPQPVSGAAWTSTRLLAGYLLMCDNQEVALVYCELHTHWDDAAAFSVYEDESCDTRVMHVSMGVHTCISERVGIDCSCFSVDGNHFSARSSAEKSFWLRAVSNVKVKLRHRAHNPSDSELSHFRASVAEGSRAIRDPHTDSPQQPLLPPSEKRRRPKPGVRSQDNSPRTISAPSTPRRPSGGPGNIASGSGPGNMMGSGSSAPRSSPSQPSLLREDSLGADAAPDAPPDAPPDVAVAAVAPPWPDMAARGSQDVPDILRDHVREASQGAAPPPATERPCPEECRRMLQDSPAFNGCNELSQPVCRRQSSEPAVPRLSSNPSSKTTPFDVKLHGAPAISPYRTQRGDSHDSQRHIPILGGDRDESVDRGAPRNESVERGVSPRSSDLGN